jgi:pimeloyl-ACP methyl ester carboxylesterase
MPVLHALIGLLFPPWRTAAVLLALACGPLLSQAQGLPAWLSPCHVDGVDHQVLCGRVERPLNPADPASKKISLRVVVLPAVARNKQPDPVFLLAGGPGQSAVSLAGSAQALFRRLLNRRDVVLVDQRGTGDSAPLFCPEPPVAAPLGSLASFARQVQLARECLPLLQQLPHGDLRQYTTVVAMQDLDAVRQALGAPQINLVGASYGTRAGLEYLRQFPQAVRRAVLDGLAPPDMVLPVSFAADNQAALEQVYAACAAQADCRARHPALKARVQALLKTLPKRMSTLHPVTGEREELMVDGPLLVSLVRMPLYVPVLASALPAALEAAQRGELTPLVGLNAGMGAGNKAMRMAIGMHFSVICSEDGPRLPAAGTQADEAATEFGNSFAERYRQVCDGWPRGPVPPAFYKVPAATQPVLLLSGGADPATPPRHAERVLASLGAQARHLVLREAGHGTLSQGCVRDAVFAFINAETAAQALAAVDAPAAGASKPPCSTQPPRPGIYRPVLTGSPP